MNYGYASNAPDITQAAQLKGAINAAELHRDGIANAGQDQPLTLATREAMERHIAAANQARNTLACLRDRLFGCAPATANNASAGAPSPQPLCYVDGQRQQHQELMFALAVVNQLAMEIESRL